MIDEGKRNITWRIAAMNHKNEGQSAARFSFRKRLIRALKVLPRLFFSVRLIRSLKLLPALGGGNGEGT